MRRFLIVFSVLVVCVAASVVGVGAPLPRAAAADPVIAAAGDIACPPPGTRTANRCHQAATADLLAGATAVLPLGDEQYNCGQLSAFNQVYDPSWGRFKGTSNPVVGDNEYAGKDCSTPGASGYYTYFGSRASPQQPTCKINCKGYYSYDVGSWHMVALNSECTQPGVGGCSATSPQVQWLNADLAAHRNTCTLAYFHRPYFSDNGGTVAKVRKLFTALYNGGADVLLVGHDHIYERFQPQNPSGGREDLTGIRQFIVGTGGRSSSTLAATPPTGAERRNTGTYGVLKLTLHPTSYDWQFVPEPGKSFTDSGSQACD
jgi:acid phosphatase type 7